MLGLLNVISPNSILATMNYEELMQIVDMQMCTPKCVITALVVEGFFQKTWMC